MDTRTLTRTGARTVAGLALLLLATACAPALPSLATAASAGPAMVPAIAAPTTTPPPPVPTAALEPGDEGPEVLALQEALDARGYWLGTPDGTYGELTEQAVLAVQGAAGLERDGVAGEATLAALADGALPDVRSTSGEVTEIDRDAGTISFVDDGVVTLVLHTSTGTFEEYSAGGVDYVADTPEGDFTVTWAQDGWREGDLGRLYRPRYFHEDGIAVHGYSSVPAYPASHGCARVTNDAIDMIWERDLMPLDSEVLVY